jgi:2-phosphoglycerate kinase
MTNTPWQVLLIGGASGSGKTTVAQRIGRQTGASWLQLDDLRLTLQFGGLLIAGQCPDLFYFLQLADVLQAPTAILLEKMITIASLMAPAVSTVVHHHIATNQPMVLEGDGIAPALAAQERSADVRAIFLVETDEETLYRNMLARGRGLDATNRAEAEEQQRAWIRLAWLYNQWLDREARRYGPPVLSPRPYATLAARISEAVR